MMVGLSFLLLPFISYIVTVTFLSYQRPYIDQIGLTHLLNQILERRKYMYSLPVLLGVLTMKVLNLDTMPSESDKSRKGYNF